MHRGRKTSGEGRRKKIKADFANVCARRGGAERRRKEGNSRKRNRGTTNKEIGGFCLHQKRKPCAAEAMPEGVT